MSCTMSLVAPHAGVAPPLAASCAARRAAVPMMMLPAAGRAARLAGRAGQLAAGRRGVVTRAGTSQEKVSHVLDVRAAARA
jgi:hypothetical protein